MDLCVIFNDKKYIIELKILYNNKIIEKGKEQIAEYMDTMDENCGWLIIFDRDTNKSWDEKIYSRTETYNNKTIHILGC